MMTATAHQLRRRRVAAETIVARLTTVQQRKRFIAAAPLVCANAADALYSAISGYTDYPLLLALAGEIAPSKRRRARRAKPEKNQ